MLTYMMSRGELWGTLAAVGLLVVALVSLPSGTDAFATELRSFRVAATWERPAGPPSSLRLEARPGVPVRVEEQHVRLEIFVLDGCRSDQEYRARVRGTANRPVLLTIADEHTGQLGSWKLGPAAPRSGDVRIDRTVPVARCARRDRG